MNSNKLKITCFVPIKLKSQRLPDKMLLPLGEKRLADYIFDTLISVKNERDIDIYCYCSDNSFGETISDEINYLQRDSLLDSNETLGMDIYNSFVELVDSDIYILCHATSPFLTKESIIKGIDYMINGYDSAFTVSRIQTFSWFNNKTLNYSRNNIIRTQDIEPVFYETSAYYMFTKDVILSGKRIGDNSIMVETSRIESIDIDEKDDYDLAFAIAS